MAVEDALPEISSTRRLTEPSLAKWTVPRERTILNFGHLLETSTFGTLIFEAVSCSLVSRGLQLTKGIIVNTTIFAAPSSTKSAIEIRDPEMHQTKNTMDRILILKTSLGCSLRRRLSLALQLLLRTCAMIAWLRLHCKIKSPMSLLM